MYAAAFILLGGRLIYYIVERNRAGGSGEVVAYLVFVVVVGAFATWRYLRHRRS